MSLPYMYRGQRYRRPPKPPPAPLGPESPGVDIGEAIDTLTLDYISQPRLFFAEQLKIKAKDGRIIPLILNSAQLHVHEVLETQRQHHGRVRAIILKGRQQGISTYIEARFFHRVTFNAGLRAFILTHEQSATNTIFEMADRFYLHIDAPWRLETTTANAKELRFVTDAGYQVATAGAKGTGRSKTVHLFHGSEVAFWPSAADHASGVLQAVPDEAGTEIILESTAHGHGGYYHSVWRDAWTLLHDRYSGDVIRMARHHSGFVPIFIPWFWQQEYRSAVPDGFEPTPDEQAMAARYRLDTEQLVWRRAKIAELQSEDQFKQEYPCEPHEAFLRSGHLFFPPETLEWVRDCVRDPIARGVLEWQRGKVVFKSQSDGWLRVWEEPRRGEHYVIGADVSEGRDDPADRSVADVLRRGLVTEQVAQIIPQCEADEYARRCVLVAEWYGGNTPLAIERNGLGLAAVIAARDTGYRHLYKMHQGEARVGGDDASPKLGWETTVSSRPVLCSQLLMALRDKALVVHSRDTAEELASFVVRSGKPQASTGCRDDCVFSLGIAWQMIQRTHPIETDDSLADERPLPTGPTGWMA